MDDPITEVRRRVAYKIHQIRPESDANSNWSLAGEVLEHFLMRRPECLEWQENEKDWGELFGPIIYGKE